MNLVILGPDEVDAHGVAQLDAARGRHLVRVLAVGPGRTVRVGRLDGPFGVGTVLSVEGDRVALHCTFEERTPERPRVDLLLALPRPKVLRRLWAPLASLGVGRLILTNAAKIERNYFDTHVLDAGVYQPLLIDGLQQARDTRLPLVSVHKQFRKLVESELDAICPGTRRLVAHPDTSAPRVAHALHSIGIHDRVLLAVGPEGGWNDFERTLLAARGFEAVSLGPRTLTTTTACVALLALVHDAMAADDEATPAQGPEVR